ncbi:MAG: tRNA (N6-threonylcarbamoyladenosine(37)-N6)-methyltransferase TrmO [Planctomycetota bacterium]|nr:tRNA (N6-threonylcarbamoyladenosine(37)-N6)-methyltransferase TrmO [Planctomycetota bacterium]
MSEPDGRAPRTPPLAAIGLVRCSQALHHEAPRQSGLGRGSAAEIELFQGMQNGLKDLDGFSHIWVVFWCHHARGAPLQVQPPRDVQKRGVFATRAPQRPNPLGLSCVRLETVTRRVLRVSDCDLLDGTPVLDIKPYLPYCDSVPDAETGYVASLPEDAQDHREWWRDRGVAPPRRYEDWLQDPSER